MLNEIYLFEMLYAKCSIFLLQSVIIYDNLKHVGRTNVMKRRYQDGTVPQSVGQVRRNVASQIREARKSLNITQEDLAKLSGTQKSNISRMESGRYNPSLDLMVKVAGSLGRKVSISLDEPGK